MSTKSKKAEGVWIVERWDKRAKEWRVYWSGVIEHDACGRGEKQARVRAEELSHCLPYHFRAWLYVRQPVQPMNLREKGKGASRG